MAKSNFIDNLIGIVSPKREAERLAWRNIIEEQRHYDAGDYSRLNTNWRAINESAEMTDRFSRDNVKARARDLERNSDIMYSLVGAFKRNVIGKGYVLQPRTGNGRLDDEILKNWKRWCKKKNCDITGIQSFNQMMRMCVVRKKVDGGIIIAKRYTRQGFVPLQLQIFEVDELDTNQMTPKRQNDRVVGGIEYNSWNRPIGYWLRQYSLDGMTLTEPVYIPAKDVIFYYSKRRPSQIREMSDMSQTLTRIRDTNEFMTAVSVKQRIEACLSVFIKKTIPTTGIGRGVNNASRMEYDSKMLAPGMIRELNAGDEIQVVNPSGQATDATMYIKEQQHIIGAGQGLSYEATSRDMSETNYSSARQGIIEDDLTYEEERELLLEAYDEIYESFLISCALAGIIKFPEDFFEKKEQYFQHVWVNSPKPWIDPVKETNANMTALRTGQKTFKQIAAENGRDWKEQIDEMAEVLEYGNERGIEMGGVIFGQNTETSGQKEEEKNVAESDKNADKVNT